MKQVTRFGTLPSAHSPFSSRIASSWERGEAVYLLPEPYQKLFWQFELDDIGNEVAGLSSYSIDLLCDHDFSPVDICTLLRTMLALDEWALENPHDARAAEFRQEIRDSGIKIAPIVFVNRRTT